METWAPSFPMDESCSSSLAVMMMFSILKCKLFQTHTLLKLHHSHRKNLADYSQLLAIWFLPIDKHAWERGWEDESLWTRVCVNFEARWLLIQVSNCGWFFLPPPEIPFLQPGQPMMVSAHFASPNYASNRCQINRERIDFEQHQQFMVRVEWW